MLCRGKLGYLLLAAAAKWEPKAAGRTTVWTLCCACRLPSLDSLPKLTVSAGRWHQAESTAVVANCHKLPRPRRPQLHGSHVQLRVYSNQILSPVLFLSAA